MVTHMRHSRIFPNLRPPLANRLGESSAHSPRNTNNASAPLLGQQVARGPCDPCLRPTPDTSARSVGRRRVKGRDSGLQVGRIGTVATACRVSSWLDVVAAFFCCCLLPQHPQHSAGVQQDHEE